MSNARKHVTPDGSDVSVGRATIFDQFGQSISDVVPVANTTDRAQVVADLTAEGHGPTASRPLVVIRADAPGLHRIEYTYDGTTFVSGSGTMHFASKGEADSFATSNSSMLTEGDRCIAGGVEYRRAGASWVPAAGAVTPTAVSGAGVSIGASGQVLLTSVPESTIVQIRGVFSGAFRNYSVVARFTGKPSAAATMNGIVGATVAGGSAHSFSRQSYVGGGRGDAQGVTQGNFAEGIIPINGSLGGSRTDILGPNAAEATYVISQHAHLGGFAGVTNLSASLNSADQLTGLQIATAAGGVTSGEIFIYGTA